MINNTIYPEQCVLGSILQCGDLFTEVSGKLGIEDFTLHTHKVTWEVMIALNLSGDPIDVVTVGNLGAKAGGDGYFEYLAKIALDTPKSGNLVKYAEILASHALDRRISAAVESANNVADGDERPVEKLSAIQGIFADVDVGSSSDGPVSASIILRKVVDDLDVRFQSDGKLIGLSTGLDDIDDITMGLQKADLVILAGRPSSGKTTLSMNLAENNCRNGLCSLVFSMEMPSEQLINRMTSSISGIPFDRIQTGKLLDEDWPLYTNAVAQVAKWELSIDDTAALTVAEITARAIKFSKKHNPSLIVIDYLQLIKASGRSKNEEIGDITAGLKALAKILKIPVVLLSQLNRSLEQRPNKRPVMSDLRDSGSIEQDADVIIFIYRDEVYNPETPMKGIAEIIFAKQRNAAIGKVNLATRLDLCRFENFTGVLPAIQETQTLKSNYARKRQ